ncbi:hypothetical protein ABF87_09190 [Nitrosomonas sp. JL21]|uniref:argonaute/piwi family protein n=1 Tax=Nitrosomonas sp. JL21 TaxID=153949 RepID=UPI001368BC96|nr:hypothetical protein [Nitrosomonas sp. JL21]MBL8496798.1 hypothetical protein [Nitrosomonas sp.]MBL8498450.1 hypothetical protein [Nitrosomonas sp.]MXS78128.1 hypothetical protein [Nitrosomonas sp. JL21]
MDLPEKSMEVVYIPEPNLSFGHGQSTDHPKDGLFLYGPHSGPAQSREVKIGVIGTTIGLGYFRSWAIKLGGFISIPSKGKLDKEHRLHLSNFPGLEEAFGLRINPGEFVQRKIDLAALDNATKTLNQHEAVKKAVDLYLKEIEHHDKNEERTVDIWIFVLPELVFERCKPLSRRSGLELKKGEFLKTQKKKLNLPLFADIINQDDEAIFDDVPDFHRQVKARLLKLGHTSQLLRETTLAPDQFVNKAGYPLRTLQEPASVAWNLATGLYYKTQPEPPWKLANVRPGVCYIGLVFKMIPNDGREHACCAAQMFLNEGDAVVFRGANGPWKTGDYDFHLKAPEAKRLISRVLETFKDKHGTPPKEFFIHGKTTFNEEEWNAFAEAAPPETNVVAVRIKTTTGDTKLFRNGDYPVLRGTAIILDDKNAYLWTTGFVPRLDTYIGPETPNPLFVTILRSSGESPNIRTVLTDIMGLTKINYNACNYSDGLPVTVRFAGKVGDVLTMGSAKDAEKQPLKFYV